MQDLGITASGAIGYKEFLPYFQGTASLEEAVEQLSSGIPEDTPSASLPGLSGMPGSIGFLWTRRRVLTAFSKIHLHI